MADQGRSLKKSKRYRKWDKMSVTWIIYGEYLYGIIIWDNFLGYLYGIFIWDLWDVYMGHMG